jgi:hypothetical protein
MIDSTEAMLTVFWGIHCVIFVNWLPQGMSFNGTYFNEYILQPMGAELHEEEKAKHPSGRLPFKMD